MSFLKVVKRFLPKPISDILVSLRSLLLAPYYWWYDFKRYIRYSGIILHGNNQTKMIARITMIYHSIEKGLVMPVMRLGFGTEAMNELVMLCNDYLSRRYDTSHCQFQHALGVIKEYKSVHREKGFILNEKLEKKIDALLNAISDVAATRQIESGSVEYFAGSSASFDKFSCSRHSVRHFSDEEVPLSDIRKAVELAQNAPSSCNRQSSRVHIITDKEVMAKVLAIQNGNRGFGHLANKLAIVTAELGVYNSIKERHAAWVDGGMFAMNLLYALHFYHIGACALNCYFSAQEEEKVRILCGVPRSEIFIAILALGKVPEKCRIASSKRLSVDEIMRIR